MNEIEMPDGSRAKLVGRRLVGGPESWDPATQEAVHALSRVVAMAKIPVATSPELDPAVRRWTDEAARRHMDDEVFDAQVTTVVRVMATRRAFEGFPFDDFEFTHATVAVALALVMHDDLNLLNLASGPAQGETDEATLRAELNASRRDGTQQRAKIENLERELEEMYRLANKHLRRVEQLESTRPIVRRVEFLLDAFATVTECHGLATRDVSIEGQRIGDATENWPVQISWTVLDENSVSITNNEPEQIRVAIRA